MAKFQQETQSIELDIEGMTCTACARRIEKNLNKIAGVSAYVDFASERAHVSAEPQITKQMLVESIEDAGYSVGSDQSEMNVLKWRVIIGVVLSIPVLFTSMIPVLMFNMWLTGLLALPVASYVAMPFHLAAFKNLRHRSTTMDTLVSLGVLVAFGYSVYSLFIGSHEIYFEVAAVVPTVVLIGRWLEVRTRRSATDSVRALLNAVPATAQVRRDGLQVTIPVNQIVLGDLVSVASGERIPVDGLISEGFGVLDNSLITGESVPENVVKGMHVVAGSLNLNGNILVEATAISSDSRISQIANLVREASATKPKITSITDRISSYFVPGVILLAAGTYLVWAFGLADNHTALSASIAVLVIACPCALGIAVPISLAVATAQGAKRGIVIRTPDALSILNRVDTVVLDKTGTLTDGLLEVEKVIVFGDNLEQEAMQLAAALERGSNHPIAKAIANLDTSLNAVQIQETPGSGVTGIVNGETYSIGYQENVDFRNQIELEAAIASQPASSLAVLSRGKQAIALFTLADKIRLEAKQAIDELKAIGTQPVVISGDTQDRVEQVAQELGIGKRYSRVSPEKKLDLLRTLKAEGRTTAMVGDGLNDVAALAGADVGIAMGSGTHAAQSASALTILDDNPMGLPYALDLSKRTWRNIRQNLVWAFGYNVALIPVAALGLLNPMYGGIAMTFSSVSVVLNALRLNRDNVPKRLGR